MIIKDIQSDEPDTIWSSMVNVEDAAWVAGSPIMLDMSGTDAGNPLIDIWAGIDGVSGRAPDTTAPGTLYHKGGITMGTIKLGEAYSARGHGGMDGSPLGDRFAGTKLRVLDVAVAAFPGAMHLLDPPAKRVSTHNFYDFREGVGGLRSEQHP